MNSENCFKKIYLLIFVLAVVVASAKAAPTAYAVYSDGTFTFKYGEMPTGQAYCFDVSDTGNKKAQWSELAGSINKAVFDGSFASARPKSCYDWFYDCKNLKEITGIENLNTSDVTSMYGMFLGCSSLKSLDVSGFNTSNVTDMEYMFYDCYGLTSLDLSSFNTSNVTNMCDMFSGCKRLTSLVVSGFNTSNVTNMQYMFGGCSVLTSLDVSGFNTSNVTVMCGMFSGCTGLTKLDVSGFNTSKVTNMSNMFYRCYGLMSLDVGGFNTQNVTNMRNMFYLCSGLTSLDVSGFNTQNVTNMRNMFGSCESLKSLDLSSFNTSKVTDMSSMFYGCSKLTTIYCNDTWNCYESTDMFNGCAALKGAISYNSSNIDVTYANPETGYFTKKAYELVLGGYAVSTKGEQYKAGVVEGTVTFDPSTFTLYMKDATITGGTTYGIYSKLPELNIVAEGNCTVTSTNAAALSSARGNLTFSGNGTLTLQGITGLTAVTNNPAEGNEILIGDSVTLIVEGTGGNGIVGGTSSGTYYTTLRMIDSNAVLKVKGANYDLFRIKDVDFLFGQHVALPTDAYFSTANHTIMSNGSALKNTWAEFSTKKYVNKITITDYTWPSDFEAADYEASTSTTGCKVTDIVYSMYQKMMDMSNPDYVQAGDNVGVCFTVELDEGYTFADIVNAYIERDGVTLPHEYRLVGSTDREKRFLWTYTIPTPEGGSYVRTVTESVTAPVAGAEPVWTSENSATATAAGAKAAEILPEPTVKEKFDRGAAHVVKSIEWYETGRDGERKMQQGESFQRGKGYAVWLTVAPVSGKQFHEHTLYKVNTDTAATVTRQSNAEAGAFVVRQSSQQALLGYVFSVPDTDVLLGDVNGDGSVTVNDIVKITQYVLGTSHEIDTAAADVNVDGSVTVTDIVYVTYYILYGVFPSQAQAKAFAAEWDMEE
ncbi:MAG: BspA family leucine-rich repeat surface protein [Prevotella sp.]|nr:BspA family leucine-rich repeat surface protein [Prevotella sp.]